MESRHAQERVGSSCRAWFASTAAAAIWLPLTGNPLLSPASQGLGTVGAVSDANGAKGSRVNNVWSGLIRSLLLWYGTTCGC